MSSNWDIVCLEQQRHEHRKFLVSAKRGCQRKVIPVQEVSVSSFWFNLFSVFLFQETSKVSDTTSCRLESHSCLLCCWISKVHYVRFPSHSLLIWGLRTRLWFAWESCGCETSISHSSTPHLALKSQPTNSFIVQPEDWGPGKFCRTPWIFLGSLGMKSCEAYFENSLEKWDEEMKKDDPTINYRDSLSSGVLYFHWTDLNRVKKHHCSSSFLSLTFSWLLCRLWRDEFYTQMVTLLPNIF